MIVVRLSALISQRAPKVRDKDDWKRTIAASDAVLHGLPKFAVAAAFEAAQRGQVGKPAYPPTAAEILIAAQGRAGL